ncbi:hypothetical protein ACFY0P_21535 [Streptomyces sp. NPDC001714]|uniref:hypothetical protein n=1 Tax=Streptomyces sp. NPDC001714 TaxID=3364603 RepID=UPI0036CD70CF
MRTLLHTTAAAAGALAALLASAPPVLAAGARDVTADVLADRDVTLTGDTVVTVPAGTTTYDGVLHGEGTLTVRGGGTLILTRDSDFTLPKARQRQVVRTQGGNHPYGTVLGSVTNDSLVATGVTVRGDYAQHKRGELALQRRPLKVSGRVALAGALDMSAVGTDPARRITVIDHTGKAPTTGTFDGLAEGTAVKLADTVYRLTYRGGDGNDVVLTAESAKASTKADTTGTTPTAPPTVTTRTASDSAQPFGWWPYALALGLLGGLVVPATRRTKREGRRRSRRHAG